MFINLFDITVLSSQRTGGRAGPERPKLADLASMQSR